MKNYVLITASLIVILGSMNLFIASCNSSNEEKELNAEEKLSEQYDLSLKDKMDIFGKLPETAENTTNPSNAAKILLGQKLYFDKQLSKDGNISCNSCHNLESFGVDNHPNSPGDAGKNGDRNSPTVLNAALHTSQFWDGRAKDVEEQAGMPILNPIEMAIPDKAFLVSRLSKSEEYQKLFKNAFPNETNPLSYDNIQKAIGCFERQLISPSRFDQYVLGDTKALTLKEKQGLSSFINIGCTSCHSGPAIGGTMIQKFGVHKNYWELTKSAKIDEGRYNITKQETDKYQFKVQSLRNIEKTAPYFHDGSVANLEDAVDIMSKTQLNYELSKEEKSNLLAFLKSLTGSVPVNYQKATN